MIGQAIDNGQCAINVYIWSTSVLGNVGSAYVPGAVFWNDTVTKLQTNDFYVTAVECASVVSGWIPGRRRDVSAQRGEELCGRQCDTFIATSCDEDQRVRRQCRQCEGRVR